MYLNEITRIKLGKTNDSRYEDFMSEYEELTQAHPFNPAMRILGQASIQLGPFNRSIHISDIMSHAPRSGAGTTAMKIITDLADKHRVKLDLTANAYVRDNDSYVTNTADLIRWYMKFGFFINDEYIEDPEDLEGLDHVDMVRTPN